MSTSVRLAALATLLGLATVAALVPGARAGDDNTAALIAEDARKALRGRNWEQAADLFREALEASETYLPARAGLGEALLGAGDQAAAVLAFRQVVREALARDTLRDEEEKALADVERRLADLDPRGQELAGIVGEHVKDVVTLAYRYREKDPDLTERALEIALTLDPRNERALELRERLAAQGARSEALFDGKQIEDWDGGRSQYWSVKNGVIVGDTRGVAAYIRTQKQIEGDFDVIVEARLVKAYEGPIYFALMAAWQGEHCHSSFGILTDDLTWSEDFAEDRKQRVLQTPLASLRRKLDPAEWNAYELRFRGNEIIAVVNGREVRREPRAKERDKGYVGLLSQGCVAEFRRVEVLHR